MSIFVRAAEDRDLPAIAALYNHEIRTGTALWHTRERSEAEMAAWFAERRALGYAVITATIDDAFAGYGALGPFRPHDGYARTVEHSLYVGAERRRRGIGGALLAALEDESRRRGARVMVGGVEAENASSVALHCRAGFEIAGRLPDVGWKFGRWLTLLLLTKRLEG